MLGIYMRMGTVVIKTLTIIQLTDTNVNGVWELCVDRIPSQSIHFIPLLYTLDSKLILEGIGWLDDKAIHAEQCLLEKHRQHNSSGWQSC